LIPPAAGADLRAALEASCLRGAFPPVDLRAVCLVLAILNGWYPLVLQDTYPSGQFLLEISKKNQLAYKLFNPTLL
jgi:hypothetical protein